MQLNSVRCNALQCNVVQCNSAQCSAVHYSAVLIMVQRADGGVGHTLRNVPVKVGEGGERGRGGCAVLISTSLYAHWEPDNELSSIEVITLSYCRSSLCYYTAELFTKLEVVLKCGKVCISCCQILVLHNYNLLQGGEAYHSITIYLISNIFSFKY